MSTWDRRSTLKGLAGAGLGLSVIGGAAEGAGAAEARASERGRWSTDAHGLPCYAFAGDVPVETTTPAGRRYPLDPDPVFLLGNSDLTLFALASGRLQFVSGEHGWVRLNTPAGESSAHTATLTVRAGGVVRRHDLLGPGGVCASGQRTTRTFGCGAARYRMRPEPGLTVERILSVPPSPRGGRAQAAVVLTVRLTNRGRAPLDLDYAETVLCHPAVGTQHGADRAPVRFTNTARLLPDGGGVIGDARAVSDDPRAPVGIDAPYRYNLHPPSLVLMAAPRAGGVGATFGQRGVEGGAVELSARSRVRLAPGATRDIVLVIALKSPQADLTELRRFAAALAASPTGEWFRQAWAAALAPFAKITAPALRAELAWDGHALLAMATHAAYFGQTFIPQGMTYDYFTDLNAGPRDHLQHAMAAAYFAPELARSSILYTLCAMTAEGAIKFTVSGNGDTAGSSWAPSDQQLFLFWTVSEYLRITRDFSLLEAETPDAPAPSTSSATTLRKLERAFAYLRDRVSIGPHGLVRLLSADWNDQIYAGVPAGQHRDTAESHMNATMVMAVMPPLIDQLGAYARTRPAAEADRIARLSREMRDYADMVSQALMRDMEGRSFARRAWLAPGQALGEDDMHLEPQSFLLLARDFPVARKRTLLREMQRRLIDGETLGPRQLERPRDVPRMQGFTSENGGFWYSLAGQAIAGVATFDREAALAMLHRMTFRGFSRRHPAYWVGQWTAPDTLNAEAAGDLGGLPRPMDDGLWCRTANYCAHAHAWPIYAYFRIRDRA